MDAQALSEVYDILNHFEPDMYNKIPQEFINYVEQNKDNNYITRIDFSKSINEQNILQETKVILSIIYRDFICDKKLKEKLERYDYNILEKKKREKYNTKDLFKNSKNQTEKILNSQTQDSTAMMIEYKENIFTKLKRFIKKFFYK